MQSLGRGSPCLSSPNLWRGFTPPLEGMARCVCVVGFVGVWQLEGAESAVKLFVGSDGFDAVNAEHVVEP
jgi:hypothetical protein